MANASETSLGGSLDELCINTMRFLSVDAVEKAKSGHPGTPMGAAFSVPLLERQHEVMIAGTHLEDAFIDEMKIIIIFIPV